MITTQEFNQPNYNTIGYDSENAFNAVVTTTNATTAAVVKSATAGKSIYISDLTISSPSALRIDLEDNDGTAVSTIFIGASVPYVKRYSTLKKITSGKALMVKSSLAVSLSVEVDGLVI